MTLLMVGIINNAIAPTPPELIDNSSEHLTSSQYVKTTQSMLSAFTEFYTNINKEMERVLSYLHNQ